MKRNDMSTAHALAVMAVFGWLTFCILAYLFKKLIDAA